MGNLESRLGLFVTANTAGAIKNIDTLISRMAKLRDLSKLKNPIFDVGLNKFREFNTRDMQAHLDKASAKARQTTKVFQGLHKVTTKGVMGALGLTQLIPKMKKARKTTNTLTGAFQRFRMEFLSFMFFGMQLQRIFTSIAKSATASFKKIMESANIQGTAIQRLGGWWEYLKFVIGSAINRALGPLMPKIERIVMAVSKWVQKNPKLVAGIIALGIALGAFMFFGSQFVLLFNGIVTLFKGPVGLAIKGLITSMGGLGSSFSALLVPLGIIAAAILVAILLWKTNFGGFADFVKDTFGVISSFVKDAFGEVKTIVSEIWKSLIDLLNGDFDGFVEHITKAALALTRLMYKIMLGAILAIANVLLFMKNLTNDIGKIFTQGLIWLVEKGINFLISKINSVLSIYNKVMSVVGGSTIGDIGKVDFSGAREYISKEFDKNKFDYFGKDDYNKASKVIDLVINIDTLGDARQLAEQVAKVINMEVAKN